jgi:hypothetical protein
MLQGGRDDRVEGDFQSVADCERFHKVDSPFTRLDFRDERLRLANAPRQLGLRHVAVNSKRPQPGYYLQITRVLYRFHGQSSFGIGVCPSSPSERVSIPLRQAQNGIFF